MIHVMINLPEHYDALTIKVICEKMKKRMKIKAKKKHSLSLSATIFT